MGRSKRRLFVVIKIDEFRANDYINKNFKNYQYLIDLKIINIF